MPVDEVLTITEPEPEPEPEEASEMLAEVPEPEVRRDPMIIPRDEKQRRSRRRTRSLVESGAYRLHVPPAAIDDPYGLPDGYRPEAPAEPPPPKAPPTKKTRTTKR